MLTVPAKRPIPPEASVKVPVIGTVIPAGGGIAREKALGTVNIPNSTAISATEIILLLIGLPSYVRNVSGLGAYFALRTGARERLRVRQTNRSGLRAHFALRTGAMGTRACATDNWGFKNYPTNLVSCLKFCLIEDVQTWTRRLRLLLGVRFGVRCAS